jgi:hypothetical protein
MAINVGMFLNWKCHSILSLVTCFYTTDTQLIVIIIALVFHWIVPISDI